MSTPSESAETLERAEALSLVLIRAADLGVNASLQQFGSPLTETEKAAVKTLSNDDITALKQIHGKLGSLSPLIPATNNNNNNKT